MHPIIEKSFAIIDREMGEHNFTPAEYAIVRRIIHTTADFEFAQLVQFSSGGIEKAIAAIQKGAPIITDVSMVKVGVASTVAKTFGNPLISAIEQAPVAISGKTRTETGLLECWRQFPEAIYVIGNAPTALLALCAELSTDSVLPAFVIGVPVGFVSVVESKAALAQTAVPHVLVEGRKGGSPVAAAIMNALLFLAWEQLDG